jgi:hypothetical protein
MSTHYNDLFTKTFEQLGYTVVYQPSCLINAYDQMSWPINFPEVQWTDNTLVVMHCQDFVSIRNSVCTELEAIEKHFADRAHQVVVIHWNIGLDKVYSGPMKLIHFPTHSYELLINLNNDKKLWMPDFDKKRTKNWQCLNGIPRKHRILIANWLTENADNGILSLEDRIKLPLWDYGTYRNCNNEINWDRMRYVYTDCDVNIVTETQYYETPGIISEKTLMAFLAQQVPIVVGYKGIVDDCEDLGFDMFRDIVNTSYDYESDSTRWHSALDINKKLLENGIDREMLKARLEHNLDIVLGFPDTLVERFFNTVREKFPSLDTSVPS